MQAQYILKCSNTHFLFCFIYCPAFFTNQRTYMKGNSVFHMNICKAQHSSHSYLCCSVTWPFFFLVLSYFFLFLVQGCLCSIKLCAANFIDSSVTSHQHFRGTEITSIQLLQWYLNSSASFAFLGGKKKKKRGGDVKVRREKHPELELPIL